MESLKSIISKSVAFIKKDIWRISLDEFSKTKSILINALRVMVLSFRGFIEDKVQLRASALTYFSMLSIVPVVAMAFGIAKGFGLEKALERQLNESLAGQEEVLNWVIQFANNMLNNAKGGWIAGIGVVVLFWAVIKVLGNIEESFNGIWQIQKGRGFARKFTDYLSILLIAPILMILSSSASVFIAAQVRYLAENSSIISAVGPVLLKLIKMIPYVIIWLLFTLLYIIMPNTKVKFKSAVVAGIVAGTIFQIVQWLYIYFQIGVSRYNAVYGGFAALPLFLIWLNISWVIVLFGAEISFSMQNVQKYEFESDSKNISYNHKRIVSLLISNLIVKNFEEGGKPLSAPQISSALKIPIRIIREILYLLVESEVVTEIQSDKTKERSYQPSIDINKITIDYILKKIENFGSAQITVDQSNQYQLISKKLNNFNELISKSPDNVLLKNI